MKEEFIINIQYIPSKLMLCLFGDASYFPTIHTNISVFHVNTSIITKVTQNNTGMYTHGSYQQTFETPNNNLDVKFDKAYQNHNNEILRTRKENKISHNS